MLYKESIKLALGLFICFGVTITYAQPIFKLEGSIIDIESNKPIDSLLVVLFNVTTGDSFETYTDTAGFYCFETLENGDRIVQHNSEFTVEPRGFQRIGGDVCRYLSARGFESTIGMDESTAFIKDFQLQSANCCYDFVIFPTVLFDACDELLVSDGMNSIDSLDLVFNVLIENPTVVIEVAAHSFDKGPEAENQTCSQQRAQLVLDYLISKGIDPARLVPVGYGETRPKFSEQEIMRLPDIEREAAIFRNNRVVFAVLSYDFIPVDE